MKPVLLNHFHMLFYLLIPESKSNSGSKVEAFSTVINCVERQSGGGGNVKLQSGVESR